jgi:hypothetical protein
LIFASLGGNSLNEASEKIPRSIFHRSDWGKKLGHHPRIHSLPNIQTHCKTTGFAPKTGQPAAQ